MKIPPQDHLQYAVAQALMSALQYGQPQTQTDAEYVGQDRLWLRGGQQSASMYQSKPQGQPSDACPAPSASSNDRAIGDRGPIVEDRSTTGEDQSQASEHQGTVDNSMGAKCRDPADPRCTCPVESGGVKCRKASFYKHRFRKHLRDVHHIINRKELSSHIENGKNRPYKCRYCLFDPRKTVKKFRVLV